MRRRVDASTRSTIPSTTEPSNSSPDSCAARAAASAPAAARPDRAWSATEAHEPAGWVRPGLRCRGGGGPEPASPPLVDSFACARMD